VGLLGRYDSADGSTHTLADVWLTTGAPAAPTEEPVALRTAVSDLTASLGRFTEQLEGSLNIAGPALNLPTTTDAASVGPLQAELSRSLAAQLSAFVDQNSVAITPLAAAPAVDLLSKDLTLAPAASVNGSIDPLTGKPPGK
jgi:hypothetical protein